MRLAKSFVFSSLFALAPAALRADINGADPRMTGAPGDQTCVSCHTGTALNGGGGAVRIILPGEASYQPGVKQRIEVEVADPTARRWGFELSARLDSDASNGQAGSFAAGDSYERVICENGRSAPCSSASVIQFATHNNSGTRIGTSGSVRFAVEWTPPGTDLGPVTLYAAGNAANGDGRNSGDHIYNTSVQLKPAVTVSKPVIAAEGGVVNAANSAAGIAPGTWVTIKGEHLASTTRTWIAEDFVDGNPPVTLDHVSVTINGKSAYVEAVSPGVVNILTPEDDAVGTVEVRVTFQDQTSEAAFINLQPQAPALFTTDGKNLAVTAGENLMFDKSSRFFSSEAAPVTFLPGDTATFFGTGFGSIPGTAEEPLVTAVIGGVPAAVKAVQLAEGMPRVVSLTVQIPESLADGTYPVLVSINGVSSPDQAESNLITVAHPAPAVEVINERR